jgi:hypothetical protein
MDSQVVPRRMEASNVNVSQPISSPGPVTSSGLEGTFETTGGEVLLLVTGTCWVEGPGKVQLTVHLDPDQKEWTLERTFNIPNSHSTFPTGIFLAGKLREGNHAVYIRSGPNAITDQFDFFSVTVIEY